MYAANKLHMSVHTKASSACCQVLAWASQARLVPFTTSRTYNKHNIKHFRSCRAAETESAAPSTGAEVYQGHYGPWTIEPEDVAEVWSYRIGLTATVAGHIFPPETGLVQCFLLLSAATAALAGLMLLKGFVGAAGMCSTGDAASAAWALNPLALLGAVGLGVSLVQIHIYMTPVKRTLQALYVLGLLGAAYLLFSHHEQPLPLLIAQQPWSIWLVGPAAAAVTGVAIKEGICYGKLEAAGLGLFLPLLCLAHLSSMAPVQLEQLLLWSVCGLGLVFAARKYTQPVKDDIGDKSVFMHMKQMQNQQQS